MLATIKLKNRETHTQRECDFVSYLHYLQIENVYIEHLRYLSQM